MWKESEGTTTGRQVELLQAEMGRVPFLVI
jgi:hypothetical protein